MYDNVPDYVVNLSRELRKNSTNAEQILWKYLRRKQLYGLKFRRQHPIYRCIADFYCDELKLIIEIDGDIHNNKDIKNYDYIKEQYLNSAGIRVIRFTNDEVISDIDNVINRICAIANLPSPLRRGVGGEVYEVKD